MCPTFVWYRVAFTNIQHLQCHIPDKSIRYIVISVFGAEASATRTAIEQTRANKVLGVPICGPSILLGDNKKVVDSASVANSQLHKRHLMLSYHYIREALATGEYVCSFVNDKYNPSDVLIKHWCHNDVNPLLRPILSMSGNVFDSPYSTWFHDNTKTWPGTKIGEWQTNMHCAPDVPIVVEYRLISISSCWSWR